MPALLLDVALRAALIAGGTAFILRSLRIRAAAGQHAAWTIVVMVMLLLPLWSLAGPRVLLPVLPPSIGSADSQSGGNPNLAVPPMGATWPIPGTADSASANGASLTVMRVLLAVYFVSAIALLIRLAIGPLHARRLRRSAGMRAGRATSARCATPVTVGWLSPVLILPEGWEGWSSGQLDAVLTHEAAHARRRDPLIQWLALLNRAIFWFHPLAWWLERRLSSLAEEACDAAVIQAGHSPQDYSEYLIDMARTIRQQGRRLNVVGMAMPGSGLPERMRHIFEEVPMKPLSRARIVSTLAFCTISSIALAAATLSSRPAGATDARAAVVADADPEAAAPVIAEPQSQQAAATPEAPVGQAPSRQDPPKSAAARPPGVMVFVPRTDLSGTWVQVGSTYNGRGRSGGDGRMISIISGAAFNCGTTCTIVQDGSTLTLTRPDQPEQIAPDAGTVVLQTDGSESTITQSTNPQAQFTATAKWDGDKLVVTRQVSATNSVTQTVSIEDGKLTVVSMFTKQDAPVTLTYEKK